MTGESIIEFANAIKNNDSDKASGLIEKIIKDHHEDKILMGIEALSGVTPNKAELIKKHGYDSIESVAEASLDELMLIPDIGDKTAEKILSSARKLREYRELADIGLDNLEGYRFALNGVVSALNSGESQPLARQISDDKYSKKRLKEIKEDMNSRATQEFRSHSERGFNRAWVDILDALLKKDA